MTDAALDARFEIGRVIAHTTGLITRNFVPFFILSIVFSGLPQCGVALLQGYLYATGDVSQAIWTPIAAAMVSIVFAMVLQGALMRASVDDLSGKGASFFRALGAGFGQILPLIGLGIMVGVAVGIGLLFLVVPGLILIVRWVVAGPIVVVEREGPSTAMGRSADLTRGHRWAIFGLCALYFVVAWVAAAGLAYLYLTLGWPNPARGLYSLEPIALAAMGVNALLQTLLSLISTVGVAAIYFELRRVNEGTDIEALAATFE